ncbi:ankyrin repeat-containing domain protein [Flagelloscypha sp. PMI_526]|nr:ankyrin repeat-containing domain protein [Flagelloscypha sp. PMI_526]
MLSLSVMEPFRWRDLVCGYMCLLGARPVYNSPVGSLAAEDGKAKLNAQVETIHDHVVDMKKAMDSDIYFKIMTWLSPIDQTAKLDSCIRARSSSTCGWIWDDPKVTEWKTTGGIFWCHAGMGTGKTIIASYIIETLKDLSDEGVVAYYYFEFTNPSTLSEEALFRSIVSQLSYTNETISRRFYEDHRNGVLQPQLKILLKTLRELLAKATRPVYIIIDALDELPLPQRRYLLESLIELFSSTAHGVHLMATSRDEVDIQEAFSERVSFDFAIRKQMVHYDIITFVDQQLAAKKWHSWPKQDVLTIRESLIDKADGMFRMVACQFDVLDQAQSTEDMRQALTSLPTTLGDTYLYILNKIPSHLQSRAHSLLCIFSVAHEPVTITELSKLLAVELGDPSDTVNLPVYQEGLRYHEPQNIVGLGTALVHRTGTWTHGLVLQFSHASVKEFLLQNTCSWCALSDELAHETTARACLALLLYNEDPTHRSQLWDINYTHENWWKHIHSNHSAQLFSQQETLFRTFPWDRSGAGRGLVYQHFLSVDRRFLESRLVCAAATSLEQLLFRMLKSPSQWKIDDMNHALHAAARMGSSIEVLTALIKEGADVNAASPDGLPPLYLGVRAGYLHVVQLLVKCGANVNAEGKKHASALLVAVYQRALDIVRALVEGGANVNVEDGSADSPLLAAVKLRALDIVQVLVDNGANVNTRGGNYGSALRLAVSQGALDTIKFLVLSGADLNMGEGYYGTALQVAASRGDLRIVKFLVESGADVNMGGGYYGSALQMAALRRAQHVVKFLVENGADVNIGGGYYGSVLKAAQHSYVRLGNRSKTRELVKFLIEKGAVRSGGRTFLDDKLEAGHRALT